MKNPKDVEERQMLKAWNNETERHVHEKLIHQLFEEQVEQNPDAVAITLEAKQISYSELNTRSNRIAYAVMRIGLKQNQPITIMLQNGPQQIEALLGVLKAGCLFVCLDANYPTNRLKNTLEEAVPFLLITESSCLTRHKELLHQLKQSGCEVLILDIREAEEKQISLSERCYGSKLLDTCPTTNPDMNVSPSGPAYIVYTSGSTGKPKGIMQSHRSFCQFIEWQSKQFGIKAPQRFAQWASIAYDASYCEIFGTLCFGATLCTTTDSVRYTPPALVKWAQEQRITVLQLVPSFCRQVIDVLKSENQNNGRHPLPHLNLLLLAGEILPVDLAYTWLNQFPNPPKLFNLYGPSESVLATYYAVEEISRDQHSIPIGRAIGGREILILNEKQQLCPIVSLGEIYIRSQYLTMGYINHPDEMAEKFIQNPLHSDYPDPVYRTGDMGLLLGDGNIEFHGRTDNLVKLHGIRVELGDIESAVRRQESIKNCAVVIRTAQRERNKLIAKEREARVNTRGGDQKILIAYYTAKNQLSSPELRRFLENKLPSHMIPQQFIQLDELPLNANHKLDVNALPEPSNLRPKLKEHYVAPRNPNEALIADIWQDTLGIDCVGVNDDFFKLGGDSLLAMQVLNRMREKANLKISFRNLFENQTVAKLAGMVQQSQDEKLQPSIATEKVSQRTTYPLSLSQQGLWFLWQLEPDNPYYTAQGSIHIRGSLNLPAFKRAWQALLERHIILTAKFGMEDGQPFQMFEERRDGDLSLIDLTQLPEPERRPAMDETPRKRAQKALDLENDPLLQAQLFKISENEHEIAITFHEIILDLWGWAIMMRDLGELYQGFLNGKDSPLPPFKDRFSDYVVWEKEKFQRHTLTAQQEYWRQELSGELPILSLPTDRPHSVSPSYRGAAKSVMLDTDLSKQLRDLGLQEDATLFMTLLAAFNVLLHVYSGQDEMIVGAPIANRTHENEALVGFFLNMLPLRTRLADNPSFFELLRQVKETVTGAITNAEYPFMWMLEDVKAWRDPSVSPVFQVMFNMLNLPHNSLSYETFDITFNELDSGYVKYDLSLYAQEHGDQLYLQLAYLTDLFDEETIDRMLKNLVVLLHSIVENPELPISALKVLNDVESQTLFDDFNDTDLDFGNDLCVQQLFEQQVETTPDRTAFICEGQRLTYAGLNTRANQLAHYLRRLGVDRRASVAICTERSFEMVVGLLGIMKAGGAYVALDPSYPLPRLYDMLEDANPSLLLVQKDLDRFDEFSGRKVFIDIEWDLIGKEDRANPVCLTTPDDLLNIVYTSSTTGKPKGTFITQHAVLNRLFWMWEAYPFRSDDVAVLQKSYALVAATWELFGALLKGISTAILSQQDVLDPAQLWEKVVTHKVTYLLATPALLEGVLYQMEMHAGQWNALRLATTSAEPISPAMVTRWKQAFPGVPLLNLYGATECASNVVLYDSSQMPPDANRVPVGKPLANMKVYVLDDRLNPVPMGVTGEMCVAGACLARGYVNLPELTADRFVPNPFSDRQGSRLYRTGDLARIRADGNIELVGRKDYQVNIRGFRVELGDIETALLRHEKVKECAVIPDDDDLDRKRLVAYVVSIENPEPTISGELSRFLQENLPNYMVPSAFVFLDVLPLTPNGKVDRRALPAPDQTRPELQEAFAAPRTPAEEVVAGIWGEIIGVEQVGIYDNFFDLGGHSLLATQVISRLRNVFDVELPLRSLFENPTVEGLVSKVVENRGGLKIVEEIAQTLKQVSRLSIEEMRAMLLEQTR